MPTKLYKADISPPSRAAMMACDVFNVPVEMIDVNLMNMEHVSSDYMKKNPVHTVPVLEDGDLVLHDSHAILMYLADTFGKTDAFYPKDVKRRALVNQKLFFETSILFPRLRSVTYSAIIENVRTVTEKQLSDIKEAYGFVEKFLCRSKFIADDEMTVADISAYSVMSSLTYIVPLDVKQYPKTHAWLKQMKEQPFSKKYNEPGDKELGRMIRELVSL